MTRFGATTAITASLPPSGGKQGKEGETKYRVDAQSNRSVPISSDKKELLKVLVPIDPAIAVAAIRAMTIDNGLMDDYLPSAIDLLSDEE